MEYTLLVSSSVAPFRKKAEKIWGLKRYRFPQDIFKPVVFFGMYHPGDYFHYMRHCGLNDIFWTGSDITSLLKSKLPLKYWFRNITNYVENEKEQKELESLGIKSEIRPSFLEDVNNFPISFKPSDKPQVYLSALPGREKEYGVELVASIARKLPDITFHIYGVRFPDVENIIFHGRVPPEQFNEEIKNYQAGLRLNEHDGFSEILAKSVLMGQYPISRIKYPMIDNYDTEISKINENPWMSEIKRINLIEEELVKLLKDLKNKKEPNLIGREFWRKNVNNYPWINYENTKEN